MKKISRRAFINRMGQVAAVLGIGFSSRKVWAQGMDSNKRLKQLKTDVAVIGAGPAGLSAALRAAELGLNVCLFEKTDKTGGTRNGGMGPFGAGTHIQEKYGIQHCTPRDAFNYFMEFNHWETDARLTSEYINNTAFTVKWLENEGINFGAINQNGEGVFTIFMHPFAPHPDYREESNFYSCSLLTDRIKANKNIDVYMETPAKKLIKTGNAVTGLIAEAKNGDKIQVTAKAVIVMTGGFMGSPEMIKKYTSYTYQKDLFHTFEMPNLTGDGIKMAWEVGAARSEMMMDVYKGMPILGGPDGTRMDWTILARPNLMVNLRGERFANEALSDRHFMANAIHRQPEGCAFLMFDSTIADVYRKEKPANAGPLPGGLGGPVTDIDEIVAEAGKLDYPYVFAADSLKDLCQQTGIALDMLKATIADYNSMCEAGNDPIFYKDAASLLPLRGPRYYAAQFCCDSFGGLGGIKINYKTEVVDEALAPIPGLYSGGSDANTMYADTYPHYLSGNTTGFAFTTGLMAAKNATAYIGTLQDAGA